MRGLTRRCFSEKSTRMNLENQSNRFGPRELMHQAGAITFVFEVLTWLDMWSVEGERRQNEYPYCSCIVTWRTEIPKRNRGRLTRLLACFVWLDCVSIVAVSFRLNHSVFPFKE